MLLRKETLLVAYFAASVATASVEDMACDATGFGGIEFGAKLDPSWAHFERPSDPNIEYFLVAPRIEIAPFTQLIVGVIFPSQRVFSIRVAIPAGVLSVEQLLSEFKSKLELGPPSIFWELIGNRDYGDQVERLDQRILDNFELAAGDGEPLLSYECFNFAILREN